MTTTEKMNLDERYKYLRIMRQQYRQVQTRRAKQELLDQMETVTGLHRKYLIQLMRPAALKRQPRQQERGPEYGPDVDTTLAVTSVPQLQQSDYHADCGTYYELTGR